MRGRAGRWQCRAGFRSEPAGTVLLQSLERALLSHSAEERLGLGRGRTRIGWGGEKKWVLELRKEFLHHLGKCNGAGNTVTETNATGCPVRFFPP